jgi:CubicO group peptidase (beta-lactamase class C family)
VLQVPAVLTHGKALLEERLTSYSNVSEIGWVLIDAAGVYPGPGATRRFRIASMTKSFTAATALAVVIENRELTLAVRLREIVPELPPALHHATLHDALAMTTGLPTDDAWADRLESMSREAFVDLISQPLIMNQPPGVNYEYSNLGYAIAGLVLERITGKQFEDLLHEYVVDPLGLDDTGLAYNSSSVVGAHPHLDGTFSQVTPTGPGAFSPIGGLWSTPHDIGHWMFTLRRARYRYLAGHKLTPDELVAHTIQTPQAFYGVAPQDQTPRLDAYASGLHYRWDTHLGEFLSHSGGYPGFGSHMRWHTQTGLGIAVLGNRTYFPAEEIAVPILEELVRATDYAPDESREKAAVVATFHAPEERPARNLQKFLELTEAWDDKLAAAIFSNNVFQDHTEAELKQRVTSFQGDRLNDPKWLSRTEVMLETRTSSGRLQVLFNPLGEIQKFTWQNATQ